MTMKEHLVALLKQKNALTLNKSDVSDYLHENTDIDSHAFYSYLEPHKSSHGMWNFAAVVDELDDSLAKSLFIPDKDPNYIPTGYYENLKKILDSKSFINSIIVGPTGAGKSVMVEQIHNEIQKPLVRVNVTVESDEDSLMGGMRIKDGSTFFQKGPVIQAMEMGATLLLDELDLISPSKGMCLQSVLEKGTYLIKKTGERVKAQKGFKIVATANTKGGGDENGHYIGTQILNAAMLDRFGIFFEATYPDEETETNIVKLLANNIGLNISETEISHLVRWANKTRSTEGENMDLQYSISTRRLCDIVKTFEVFGNFDEAVKMCLSRFDSAHSEAFWNFFEVVRDETINGPSLNQSFKGKTWTFN